MNFSGLFNVADVLVLALGLASAYPCKAASEIVIHFKRGAYDAQVRGELISMHDEVSYLVSASAGQHLKI